MSALHPAASGPRTCIGADDYAWVCRLVSQRTANHLGPDKQYLVQSRLDALARELDAASVADLIANARASPCDSTLRTRVVEAILTHETSFFRDRHPFDALRDAVLPAIFRADPHAPLHVWSAAGSTGQEAYSVAMLLQSAFPAQARRATILCTDVDASAVARARAGVYSQLEVDRGLPAGHLSRFFERVEAGWRARASLRDMLRLDVLDLARAHGPIPPQQVILLRNVLLYFDEPTRRAVVTGLRGALARGGYLVLGAAETLHDPERAWVRRMLCGAVVYQAAG